MADNCYTESEESAHEFLADSGLGTKDALETRLLFDGIVFILVLHEKWLDERKKS